MEYTFKKDFGFFKANDVLTWNEDIDAFTMDVEDGNSFRSAMIDERTVEDLRLEGLLAANAEPENDKIFGLISDNYAAGIALNRNDKLVSVFRCYFFSFCSLFFWIQVFE